MNHILKTGAVGLLMLVSVAACTNTRDPGQRAAGGAPLQRKPIDAGGVEPVHGRPAVKPIADIGGHALLARELDEPRNEAVFASAMDRGGEPDG